MYAAAGGASLASRQARQKQRQKKSNEQRAQQLKAQKVDFSKTPQDRQFHNYTADPPLPKGISRIERAAALKPPVQPHERRHSTSNYHLKDHHTSRARIRESPSISIPVVPNHQQQPLTPCTLVQQQEKHDRLHHESSSSLHGQLPQILIPEGDDKMERRCSFVRQVEEMEKYPEGGKGVLDRCNHICNFELKDRPTWENHTSYYSEFDKDVFGSLDYPFSEVCLNNVRYCRHGCHDKYKLGSVL